MTNKEALYWFTHNGATFDEEREMNKLIEIALTKQIPRKVGKSMIDYYCPTCHKAVEFEEHHCKCGQRLGWHL